MLICELCWPLHFNWLRKLRFRSTSSRVVVQYIFCQTGSLHFFLSDFSSVCFILFFRISFFAPMPFLPTTHHCILCLVIWLRYLRALLFQNVYPAQLLVSFVLHTFMPFWFQPISSLQSIKEDDGPRSQVAQAEMLDGMGSQLCCTQLALTRFILVRGLMVIWCDSWQFQVPVRGSFSAPNLSRLLSRHRVHPHRLPRASARSADLVVSVFLSDMFCFPHCFL